jgi:hypothetical protein
MHFDQQYHGGQDQQYYAQAPQQTLDNFQYDQKSGYQSHSSDYD